MLARFLIVFAVALGMGASAPSARPKTVKRRTVKQRGRRVVATPRPTAKQKQRLSLQRKMALPRDVSNAFRKAEVVTIDLDNVAFDTRPRTVAAVRAFARTYRGRLPKDVREALANIGVDGVGWDTAAVANAYGLSKRATEALAKLWLKTFWRSKNFALDTPIERIRSLTQLAVMDGKRVVYVSGRTNRWLQATIDQLVVNGFPGAQRSNIFLKPPGQRTPVFKRGVLEGLAETGDVLHFDDAPSVLEGLVGTTAGITAVDVQFPVREPGYKASATGALVLPYRN